MLIKLSFNLSNQKNSKKIKIKKCVLIYLIIYITRKNRTRFINNNNYNNNNNNRNRKKKEKKNNINRKQNNNKGWLSNQKKVL